MRPWTLVYLLTFSTWQAIQTLTLNQEEEMQEKLPIVSPSFLDALRVTNQQITKKDQLALQWFLHTC